MKSTLRVPFGLKDDKLYEPTQVPNGKACGCVCPACKNQLVAKQKAKTPHFAHAQDENCSRGLETAVHLAVKQIIAEKLMVRLPAVVWKNPLPRKNETKTLYVERTIQVESVALEQRVDDFIPDIVVVANNITYLVEVAVTHFINDKKQEKIDRKKIPTFEIDVSSLKSGFNLENLEKAVYTSSNYQAEWKYHPRLEELNLEAAKAEKDRVAKIEEENQERERKFEVYKNLSPDEKLQKNLKSIGLSKQQMNLLSVFVAWEDSFNAPRIVWQSAVLAYIANAHEEDGFDDYYSSSVNSSACLHWLEKIFEVNPKVKDGEKIAVWKYFKHLEELGVLKFLSHKDFVIFRGKKHWQTVKAN